MGPQLREDFKTLLSPSYNSFPFKPFLNVSCDSPHKSYVRNFTFQILLKQEWNLLWPIGKWHNCQYLEYLRPFSILCHLGVIWYTCLKMTCNLKTAGRGAKRREMWDVGGGRSCKMGYLWPFGPFWGTFSTIISQWLVTHSWYRIM